MKVRIKTWDEMEKEFGINNFYSYPVLNNDFCCFMDGDLPENRIIIVREGEELIWNGWCFNKSMIAEILED